jgi:hypothetical protein
MQRFIIEEAKKQSNIESITSKSFPLLDAESKPEEIEDDWITNFFDKCRLISDDEMQIIWSKILAGESNSPGKFSKRTIEFLSSMDKYDAELFSKLCSFNFDIDELTPLIYDFNNKIYDDNGINFSMLSHLESIGLIRFDHFSGYQIIGLEQKCCFKYFKENIWVEFPKPDNNGLNSGEVIFTQVGIQLAKVCESTPIDRYRNYIKEKWQGFGYKVYDIPPTQ